MHPLPAALLVVIVTLLAVFALGRVTPGVEAHGTSVIAFAAALAAVLWIATRGRRELRRATLGALVMTLLVVGVVGAVMSRPTSVDEDVVTATRRDRAQTPATDTRDAGTPTSSDRVGNVLVAEGNFESLEHEVEGTVRVIRMPDGSQVLTLTDFKTDPGPDLFVWAVAGDPEGDDEVRDHINAGKLKGTSGNQQYRLPEDFDAGRYRHVYVWCRAFTVGFGRAELA